MRDDEMAERLKGPAVAAPRPATPEQRQAFSLVFSVLVLIRRYDATPATQQAACKIVRWRL